MKGSSVSRIRHSAVVVGAGIAGLATAIGLRRAGWHVVVLERAAAPDGIGAGITLWPNALRALDALEVGASIREHATHRVGGGIRTPTGRWLARSIEQDLKGSGDVVMLMVHRSELYRELRAALPADVVVTGTVVDRVEQDATGAAVHYRTDNGPGTLRGDVVVGADGLHSVTRRRIWPEAAAPQFAGVTAWRGVTGAPFALDAQSQTLGSAAEVGLTQLVDGRVYWFATGDDPEGAVAGDERAEVLRRFGSWHSPIADVVHATPPHAVLRHDLYRLRRPFPSFARGRVVLVGDAAHAMLPTLGQGGCLALEDAVTLGVALASAADVPGALHDYDAARRPRTEALARRSDQTARVTQARHPVAVALRTAVIAAMPARVAVTNIARTVAWEVPETPADTR